MSVGCCYYYYYCHHDCQHCSYISHHVLVLFLGFTLARHCFTWQVSWHLHCTVLPDSSLLLVTGLQEVASLLCSTVTDSGCERSVVLVIGFKDTMVNICYPKSNVEIIVNIVEGNITEVTLIFQVRKTGSHCI